MLVLAEISSCEGEKYRVIYKNRLSFAIGRLKTLENEDNKVVLKAGDWVLAFFPQEALCGGFILGKVEI